MDTRLKDIMDRTKATLDTRRSDPSVRRQTEEFSRIAAERIGGPASGQEMAAASMEAVAFTARAIGVDPLRFAQALRDGMLEGLIELAKEAQALAAMPKKGKAYEIQRGKVEQRTTEILGQIAGMWG